MAKVPLTTAGVQTKQQELFALEQPELDMEAHALVTDFRVWMTDNFELSSDEHTYLETAEEDFIRMVSSVVFVSVRNRLPFDFVRSPVITAVKRFDAAAKFDFNYTWGGVLETDTQVQLDIIYE